MGEVALGPDGLPAAAYGAARSAAAAVLVRSSRLVQAGSPAYDGANESLLVSTPKASLGADTPLIEAEAGSLRPLALQNMDTNILARAAARPLQAALGEWAMARQRGFVPRRVMLENFIELEAETAV